MTESAPDFNHNEIIYSVSEVSYAIKRMVEDRFGAVKLRGEITGYKLASSGHAYFRLKDDGAVIDAVMWRGTLSKLPLAPEDGLEIVASGKLTTYPGKSSYQIVVDFMEPAGAGALMALLEKRRAMLEAEGLFAAARKKKLPYMPQVVGVITSPTGAVIRDILHRISDRFPCHVIVWPVAVQGEGAAEQIVAAINGFNSLAPNARCPIPDLLIVARGGGSLEDLWAFNEEIVVRAAAASAIPLISAVGHETDTTLIDYASDVRAPTPTAAAEMAVPVLAELRLAIAQMEARLHSGMTRQLQERGERLLGLARGLPKPQQLLQFATQRLDDITGRLQQALPVFIERKSQQWQLAVRGLSAQPILREIEQHAARLEDYVPRLHAGMVRRLQRAEEKIAALAGVLEQMNVQRILERGFVLVRDRTGRLATTLASAEKHKELQLQFADGTITVRPGG